MVNPPLSERGEETITAMSALAAVGQYLSTNSAKSTFLCNTVLVVKAILSNLPHDQDMQAQNNVISALQTQVQSLVDVVSETRIVVEKCRQDMNGFETRLSDIHFVVQEQWRKKMEIVLLHQIL